jgi:hypothetical protein
MVWLLVEEARDALPLPNHPQCERDVRFVISTSSQRAHPAQRVRSSAPKQPSGDIQDAPETDARQDLGGSQYSAIGLRFGVSKWITDEPLTPKGSTYDRRN